MASKSKLMAELIAADGTVDVANTDITGTIIGSQIADGAVSSAKLDATYLTPTGDGSGLSGIAGGFSNMQVFTSPGTWTNPGSVTKVKVTVVGGGSAGAKPVGSAFGPGGGAGGAAIEVVTIPTSPVPITRGAGGTGNGGAGGTSSFGAYCSATGGGPGQPNGSGSGGTINFNGGSGSVAGGDSNGSGMGGSSIFGGAGTDGTNPPTRDAKAYGSGGAGGNGSYPSGTGYPGVVAVEW